MTASPPTETERRAGEVVGFGGRPQPPAITLLKWTPRPNAAGTVLGYLNVETASGLRVLDIRLGVGQRGKRYLLMPAEAQRDRDDRVVLDEHGKARWFPHIDFRDNRVRVRFSDQVLPALRRAHPELFADGRAR